MISYWQRLLIGPCQKSGLNLPVVQELEVTNRVRKNIIDSEKKFQVILMTFSQPTSFILNHARFHKHNFNSAH